MKNALVFTVTTLMFVGVACAAVNSLPAPVARVNVNQASLPLPACNEQAICNPNQAVLRPGEGSPMPLCPPHQDCTGQLRQLAGEGSPMPLCAPGHKCDGQLRQDGSAALVSEQAGV